MSAPISRRELLKWASAGAGAAAVGVGTYAAGRGGTPARPTVLSSSAAIAPSAPTTAGERLPERVTVEPQEAPPPAAPAIDLSQRVLVVVEMTGGNDGLSMVVPYANGTYYDMRRYTSIGEADVLAIDGEVGYHPSLPRVHGRGAAIIEGVGASESDGSHFEMLARWWAGAPSAGNVRDTGFLGRLADVIGDPNAPATAISIGSGNSPAITSRSIGTLSIPNADSAGYLAGAGEDDLFRRLFQESVGAFGAAEPTLDLDRRLRTLASQSIAFSQILIDAGLAEGEGPAYPGSDLGMGLRLAAQLFGAGQGIRIVHVPMHQDFDTHDDHSGRYGGLMDDFDASVAAFFEDLDARGLSDRVLLMTTSEFGRTLRDNDSGGLDHGTASSTLLMGPVNPGRYGEHPSLTDLDDNDNLKATMGFDTYYATVAEGWFGVPASEVLDTGATPLEGVFA